MKQLLILICLAGVGCESKPEGKFILYNETGTGWDYSATPIYCDSFIMISSKECIYWTGGVKGNIVTTGMIKPFSAWR